MCVKNIQVCCASFGYVAGLILLILVQKVEEVKRIFLPNSCIQTALLIC